MSKLQEIKDQVAREYGYKDWEDRSNYGIKFAEHDVTLEEVARRFAKSVAEDALKRAVTRYKASNRILNEPDSDVTIQCIMETPINTNL